MKLLLTTFHFLFIKTICFLENSSFFSGSMDIIVINNNGLLKSSPFHIRFSLFKTLNPLNSEIKVYVNQNYIPIQVKLTKEGDIYFPNSDSNDKFTPSADTIKLFNLNSGKNQIEFELFTTFFYSNNKISAFIYLWDSSNKIVISDIDGTITRSDVLGVLLPTIGIDWTQKNIVKLYRDIERNGYKIIYLTSRAIGESIPTRNYLQSLYQDNLTLPEGPLITSSDDIIQSLLRELYFKEPQKFKVPCLLNIKSLFLNETKPFHAGFGNRDTDAFSYFRSGIINERIFIVNEKGVIYQYSIIGEKLSYQSIDEELETIFPKVEY